MADYNLGGVGKPKVQLDNGGTINLPEPNGTGRDGIEVSGFEPDILNEYRSEGNKSIEVGKMFLYNASLQWTSAPKKVLSDLFKMAAEKSFLFYPHEDDESVKYRCKVTGKINYSKVAGIKNHPAGYTIKVNLVGVEYLAAPFAGALESAAGFGTNFAESAQNQSP